MPLRRSIWKGSFVDAFLLKMKERKDLSQRKDKRIWSRRSTILPEFMGWSVQIHNGKDFIRRKVTEAMVGHKFGEFARTRKVIKRDQRDNKQKKKPGKK